MGSFLTGTDRCIEDKKWLDSGNCKGMDPSIFFPETENVKTTKNAVSICKSCPVRAECLSYAIKNEETFGVWGGVPTRVRMRLNRSIGADFTVEQAKEWIDNGA